jgi:hypothetical protein
MKICWHICIYTHIQACTNIHAYTRKHTARIPCIYIYIYEYVCMCTYICMHIVGHIPPPTFHVYIYIYIYMYMNMCICMYINAYTRNHTSNVPRLHMPVYLYEYVCMYIHATYLQRSTSIYAYIYVCIWIYIYIYICMYIHATYLQRSTHFIQDALPLKICMYVCMYVHVCMCDLSKVHGCAVLSCHYIFVYVCM